MSRRLGARSVTVALFATASLFGAVGLSSCATGNDAMTTQARTATNSVNGAVGTIELRNVYVAGPADAGTSAQIVSAFFNGGMDADEIIGVSSPASDSGTPPADPVLPPGNTKIYIADGTAPSLTGLKEDLLVGSEVKITFTFAKAGEVTLPVPVEEPPPGASAQAVPTPEPTEPTEPVAEPGATTTPTESATVTPATPPSSS